MQMFVWLFFVLIHTATAADAPQKRQLEFVTVRPAEKAVYWTPSIGLTSFRFRQTSRTDYNALFFQTKLLGRVPISRSWDFGGALALNLLPVSQQPSSHSTRVGSLALRFGYSPATLVPRRCDWPYWLALT